MVSKSTFNFIIFFAILLVSVNAWSQQTLTLEKSLEIASQKSPNIREAKLTLETRKNLLNAKNATLKSQFSLLLTPLNFTKDKIFDPYETRWNYTENKISSGRFKISQPIKWTDGTLELINDLEWRDAYSEKYINSIKNTLSSRSFNNNLFLSFKQPIFTYNKFKLEIKELELDLENATLNYLLQKLQVEKFVSEEFYNVYLKKMSMEIAIEELNNREQSYNIIKNKVDAGIAPKEEFYQAELDLATSQSKVENARVSLDNAMDSFKKLVGISIFEEISVVSDISHIEVVIDEQKALSYGIKHRLELRQKEIDIENSLFELTRTASENEFKGNINLSYGIEGTNENLADIYNNKNDNQQVSLTLQIPLWDWGEKKSQIKAAQATVDSRKLSMNDEKNNIIIGIRQAYRQVKNQVTQIKIARQNVKNAELTYEINLERYKNGDLTSMDLNLFENQLSEKKISQIEALIGYKLALLNLKIKSLWDFNKSKPVLFE